MRLIIAILVAVLISALATLVQKGESGIKFSSLQTPWQETSSLNSSSSDYADNQWDQKKAKLDGRWEWIFEAINKVLIYVLFGWAFGRIFMQLRRWIVIFLGILVISNFLLVQIGLIELTVQYENLEKIFQTIKVAIVNFGLIEFISSLIGLWAGISGFWVVERRRKGIKQPQGS